MFCFNDSKPFVNSKRIKSYSSLSQLKMITLKGVILYSVIFSNKACQMCLSLPAGIPSQCVWAYKRLVNYWTRTFTIFRFNMNFFFYQSIIDVMARKTGGTIVDTAETFWGGNAVTACLCLWCSQTSFWQLELKDRNNLDADEEQKPQLALLSPRNKVHMIRWHKVTFACIFIHTHTLPSCH